MANITIGGRLVSNARFANIDPIYGPYDNDKAALAALGNRVANANCIGLTVGIKQLDGTIKEFWLQPAGENTPLRLVEKNTDLTKSQELTTTQKHELAANINDRAAVVVAETGVVKALGYKVLNPNLRFASQVTEANTVYEIKDSFDLDGGSVTILENCTLRFNGGSVSGANITSVNGTLKVEGVTTDVINNKVFPNGYNLNSSDEYVLASQVGFVANDQSAATYNGGILDAVISSGKYLDIDIEMYLGGSHSIPTNSIFKIKGSGKITTTTSQTFVLNANASIYIDGITIQINQPKLVHYAANNIVIERVQLTNCNISGTSVMRVSFADIDYEETPYGVNNFVVTDCTFNINTSAFVIGDTFYKKSFIFSRNTINNMVYTFLNVGVSNERVHAEQFKNNCDFYIEDNIVNGSVFRSNSKSYVCFALIESRTLYYRRNKISNLISTGDYLFDTSTGDYILYSNKKQRVYPVYDSYCSVRNLYYENNVITNVCQLPQDGELLDTSSELVKSKEGGYGKTGETTLRFIKGNMFNIDFSICRELCKSKLNTTWNNDDFAKIAQVALFAYVSPIDNLYFQNNNVIVKNGGLAFPTADNGPVFNALISNNVFDVGRSSGIGLPGWKSSTNVDSAKHYKIINNVINSGNNTLDFIINAGRSETFVSDSTFEILNNISNVLFAQFTKNAKLICKNNQYTEFIRRSAQNTGFRDGVLDVDLGKIDFTAFKLSVIDLSRATIKNFEFTGLLKANVIGIGWNGYSGLNISLTTSQTIIIRSAGITKKFHFVTADGTNLIVLNEFGTKILDNPEDEWKTLFMDSEKFQISARFKTTFYTISISSKEIEVYFKIIPLEEIANLYSYDKGYQSFDGRPLWWTGSKTVGSDGLSDTQRKGVSSDRPVNPLQIGICYLDTTLTPNGKPIFYNGVGWIDSDGLAIVDSTGTLANRCALAPIDNYQFKQTGGGDPIDLIYLTPIWRKVSDGLTQEDDSGLLDTMHTTYANATYKGVQVKLTDTDPFLTDKIIKWDGTKWRNTEDNVSLKVPTPSVVIDDSVSPATATITRESTSATIYYTLDGSTPTSASTKYTEAITLADGDQVKAICIRDHMDDSTVGRVQVVKPVITFSSAGILTITCGTPDAKIYYTTDGKSPTTASTEYDSSASVTIAKGVTVNAIAVLIGRVNSEVATKTRS